MKTSTLIVGAGYGGVLTANRLAARGHDVTLVSDRLEFVDRVRLHEYAAGTRASATRPLRSMLRRNVEFVHGRVICVTPGASPSIHLADHTSHSADHVVIAVGSAAGPGPASLEGAAGIQRQLKALPARARVRIDGAGLTGIETASEIATTHPVGVLLHDPAGPLPTSSPRHRDWLRARLPHLGVHLTHQPDDADLVVDCTGLVVPSLAADSGLPVDPRGRLLLDDTLAVRGHHNLWGVGDAAVIASRPLRMGCAVAEPMGGQVADGIDGYARGRRPGRFDFGFGFHCVSLGRHDGIVMVVRRDDRPTRWRLTGRAGATVKEAISTGAAWVPGRGASIYRWLGGPR